MANLEIAHDILLAGPGFESCRQRVQRFFAGTMLLRYERLLVPEEEAVSGAEDRFGARLAQGLAANRGLVAELLANLKEEGFTALDDLRGLEKGYLSKILHTVAHLQDGFIGIDSRFYNLEEDSHGVSRELQRKIAADPGNYWILRAQGIIGVSGDDPLDALRTFEGRGGKDS
jgi:hypothetical protein